MLADGSLIPEEDEMSMLSLQTDQLRELAARSKDRELINALHGAAETIEDLSAKVRAQNLHGGWVSVDDEMPSEDETYIVAWVEKYHDCPYPHFYSMLTWDTSMDDWQDFDELKPLHKGDEIEILAWRALPEPWKEGE